MFKIEYGTVLSKLVHHVYDDGALVASFDKRSDAEFFVRMKNRDKELHNREAKRAKVC